MAADDDRTTQKCNNSSPPAASTPTFNLMGNLIRIPGAFIDRNKHSPILCVHSCRAIKQTLAYSQLIAQTALLQSDIHLLSLTDDERMCFWINIYNLLCIHACIEKFSELKITSTDPEKVESKAVLDLGFYSSASYCIHNERYSLLDIEHRVLRSTDSLANLGIPGLRRLAVGSATFSKTDPRNQFVTKAWDNRVNFALVSGTFSSGRVFIFRDGRYLHSTLVEAVRDFIKRHVRVFKITGTLKPAKKESLTVAKDPVIAERAGSSLQDIYALSSVLPSATQAEEHQRHSYSNSSKSPSLSPSPMATDIGAADDIFSGGGISPTIARLRRMSRSESNASNSPILSRPFSLSHTSPVAPRRTSSNDSTLNSPISSQAAKKKSTHKNIFVMMPKLFDWYREDFSTSWDGVLLWLCQFLPLSIQVELGTIFQGYRALVSSETEESCVRYKISEYLFRLHIDLAHINCLSAPNSVAKPAVGDRKQREKTVTELQLSHLQTTTNSKVQQIQKCKCYMMGGSNREREAKLRISYGRENVQSLSEFDDYTLSASIQSMDELEKILSWVDGEQELHPLLQLIHKFQSGFRTLYEVCAVFNTFDYVFHSQKHSKMILRIGPW